MATGPERAEGPAAALAYGTERGALGHRRHGARVRHGGHRRDGRRHRPPDDRTGVPRPRRAAAVGRDELQPCARRVAARRRVARRPLRPSKGLRPRGGLVHRRLGAVRVRTGRRRPDRRAAAAGRRSRPVDTGQPGAAPGLVRPEGPLPGDRRMVRARGPRHRGGPAARRLPDRGGLVALDLPHQPPDRARRPGAVVAPRARVRATRRRPAASTWPAPCSPRRLSPASPSA